MPLFIFLFFLLFPTQLHAESVQPAVVEDFALLDQSGNFHQLSCSSDQKAIVLFSYRIGCPISRQNILTLKKLQEEFGPQGVVFFFIDSDPGDMRKDLVKEAEEFKIDIPILEDGKGIGESLNIRRAAEAIVIDPKTWQIVYRGAVDDGLNYQAKKEPRKFYLADALTAIVNHTTPAIPRTEAKGCLVYREPSRKMTYTRDIAPILANKCVLCHTTGGVAPWSMSNFEKVRQWGPMVREVVRTERMPPWDADPEYGVFQHELFLTGEEAQKIMRWVEQGMPKGKGKDPLVRDETISAGWALGQPDLVFSLKEKLIIPANGTDIFTVVDASETVDRDLWVRAMQIKPGNRKLIHHCNIVVQKPDAMQKTLDDEQFPEGNMDKGELIAGYSPGIQAVQLPSDTGILIPKGSKISFRIHYVTTGKEEQDAATQFALYLYPQRPAKMLSVATISNRDMVIPANEKYYPVSASYTFEHAVTLTALQPHMHYRGKSMRFTAFYPDGKSEILLSVPHYRFTWQRIYDLKEPKKIPAGTRILLEGVYDNSRQNPNNLDSTQVVTYGPQSGSEMFTGILFYIK